jgi:putative intracellular protease/amidase
VLKKILLSILLLVTVLVATIIWLSTLMDEGDSKLGLDQTQAGDLPYIQSAIHERRGKILAVVSSTSHFPSDEKYAGYELTELARAYWVFHVNGYEVDIASPSGGHSPMNIDDEDMGGFDYAFLNDRDVQAKLENTLALHEVQHSNYDALYFVGGKGAMFDFPNNNAIEDLVRQHWQKGRPIAAICHGPAALSSVTLDNGEPLVKNKRLTSFTNEEELFLIPDAEQQFPFLLESELSAQGAEFIAGEQYLENLVVDGKLISGQNPWSVWVMAEALIESLGYEPVSRKKTREENSVDVLNTLAQDGIEKAEAQLISIYSVESNGVSRDLFAIHSFVSVLKGEFTSSINQIRLMKRAKSLSKQNK